MPERSKGADCKSVFRGFESHSGLLTDSPKTLREQDDAADPSWFRPPSAREHRIAAALFVGFGVFFALLFVVQAGWWFRWVVLALGVISVVHGLRHWIDARRVNPD
jgi:hypothetical protein